MLAFHTSSGCRRKMGLMPDAPCWRAWDISWAPRRRGGWWLKDQVNLDSKESPRTPSLLTSRPGQWLVSWFWKAGFLFMRDSAHIGFATGLPWLQVSTKVDDATAADGWVAQGPSEFSP